MWSVNGKGINDIRTIRAIPLIVYVAAAAVAFLPCTFSGMFKKLIFIFCFFFCSLCLLMRSSRLLFQFDRRSIVGFWWGYGSCRRSRQLQQYWYNIHACVWVLGNGEMFTLFIMTRIVLLNSMIFPLMFATNISCVCGFNIIVIEYWILIFSMRY